MTADRTPEDVAAIAGRLTKAQVREAATIARSMPKDARACILNWGDRKTPIPDSVWFGRYSHLKWSSGACSFVLSPLGLAVRAHLANPPARTDTP